MNYRRYLLLNCTFVLPALIYYYFVIERTFDQNDFIRETETNKISDKPREQALDPNEFLIERSPSPNEPRFNPLPLAVFVFHTKHVILAKLQLHLIRKLSIRLSSIEIFLDGPLSIEMLELSKIYRARIQRFPENLHEPNVTAFGRSSNIIRWALSTRGKEYFRRRHAVLLLDGDVFPLTHFDSSSLLNNRDMICRKYPATFARFCWPGFMCLSPSFYDQIELFNGSFSIHGGELFDHGQPTIQYFLAYGNPSFSWMKETILVNEDRHLFWASIYNDTIWIRKHFDRCDKCGPEIFYSPSNESRSIFYHMISATSEWRFKDQSLRRYSIYESFMNSPYGTTQKKQFKQTHIQQQIQQFVLQIKSMENIPFHGNLSCLTICQNS